MGQRSASYLHMATLAMVMLVEMVFQGRALAVTDKPNILVIWGDDIGVQNISAYNHGIMGYSTPNIDRIAKEGALFTDCLWRAVAAPRGGRRLSWANIPFRTGLLTIGMPGSSNGCRTGVHHGRAAEGAGLHDWPVRQEPSRRS